jgi:hypothetical protein
MGVSVDQPGDDQPARNVDILDVDRAVRPGNLTGRADGRDTIVSNPQFAIFDYRVVGIARQKSATKKTAIGRTAGIFGHLSASIAISALPVGNIGFGEIVSHPSNKDIPFGDWDAADDDSRHRGKFEIHLEPPLQRLPGSCSYGALAGHFERWRDRAISKENDAINNRATNET